MITDQQLEHEMQYPWAPAPARAPGLVQALADPAAWDLFEGSTPVICLIVFRLMPAI
jgi:hypothetical protein